MPEELDSIVSLKAKQQELFKQVKQGPSLNSEVYVDDIASWFEGHFQECYFGCE